MPDSGDPMDCSLPGSSVHGILQARILESVAIFCSRGSSQPRNRTWVSRIAGIFLLIELWGKPRGKIRKCKVVYVHEFVCFNEIKWAMGMLYLRYQSIYIMLISATVFRYWEQPHCILNLTEYAFWSIVNIDAS